MKKACSILLCFLFMYTSHSQGITLLYKNDLGWKDSLSWIQINTPTGQTPIKRVPTADDDVVFSKTLSGISSVAFVVALDSANINIGGGNSPWCKSMHISNTEIAFDFPYYYDTAPNLNVYTSNGGFVIIDSSSNMLHGLFQLHGGNPAITDLQILHSTYGILFSHAEWTGITCDTGARLKMVGSFMGGFYSGDNASANIFIDSSHIEVSGFTIGDNSTATLTNSMVTNNINNVNLKFFIGKNTNFISANDTVFTFADLSFTTSGSQFNGNVGAYYPGIMDFLQEDPAHPLPNIINGNLSTGELSSGMGISGDLKISGNISGFSDDMINNPIPISVNGQVVFKVAGVNNYKNNAFINNCVQDFCHYKLEFFGSTNSRISWNGGFPIDTVVINKTGCAKVTFDSSLYVSGATRIKSGQLVLNPNDNIPYKFVCAGDLHIYPGGGLFLRRDSKGIVANMAVNGNIIDDNITSDSTCMGLSNPYNGKITTSSQGITLLYKNDLGWKDSLSWIQINAAPGQTPIRRVPTANDDVVFSKILSGIPSVTFNVPDSVNINIGGGHAPLCRSMHISNTEISFDFSSVDANILNIYTANDGFVIIDSGSNMLRGHFYLHGGNPAITDLQILHSTYGVLFSAADWTSIRWDNGGRLKMVGSFMGGFYFGAKASANIFIDSSHIETNDFTIGDNSTATLTNSIVTNNVNVDLVFFIGKNTNFASANDTVFSYSDLWFTTSGSQFNGNVGAYPGVLEFLQEDSAHPLPNIINGNLSTLELFGGLGISGDLKISGNISGSSDDYYNNPIPIKVNGQEVFKVNGVRNYGSSAFINNCVQDFCHYKLEFFGNTNSRISWKGGFPIDTLVINKTGCAKVTCDSSLYVSGATRIKSGQLVLNPNDNISYKFVCAGDLHLYPGGGLFLRRDAKGIVANMAVSGTIIDDNITSDSTCVGLSNPYKVVPVGLTDFSGIYNNNAIDLTWTAATALNLKYFGIEKSPDSLWFLPLTDVPARINQQGIQTYTYTDHSFLNPVNYYRLNLVDSTGLYTYSKTIAIAAPAKNVESIFPNPVHDELYISLPKREVATSVRILDNKGSTIKTLQWNAGVTLASIRIADFPAGAYSIIFYSGNSKTSLPFIKE